LKKTPEEESVMKKFISLIFLISLLALAACGGEEASPTSGNIPVPLDSEVSFSNEDFSVTVYEVVPIESKTLVDRELTLKEGEIDQYQLYEIYMRYTNTSGRETLLKYRDLQIAPAGEEIDVDRAMVVGYCEPVSASSAESPEWCGYAPPPPKPNTYQIQPELHVPSPKIADGTEAVMTLIVKLSQQLTEIELGFTPEE
jgi:hypothetical protein